MVACDVDYFNVMFAGSLRILEVEYRVENIEDSSNLEILFLFELVHRKFLKFTLSNRIVMNFHSTCFLDVRPFLLKPPLKLCELLISTPVLLDHVGFGSFFAIPYSEPILD